MTMVSTEKELWAFKRIDTGEVFAYSSREEAKNCAENVCVVSSTRVVLYHCTAIEGYRPLGYEVVQSR